MNNFQKRRQWWCLSIRHLLPWGAGGWAGPNPLYGWQLTVRQCPRRKSLPLSRRENYARGRLRSNDF